MAKTMAKTDCTKTDCTKTDGTRTDGTSTDGTSTDGAKPPAKPAAPERVAEFRTGVSAETRAAAFLMAKGYRILSQALPHSSCEIDLIAKRLNLIAFIEVKAPATLDEAAYAVTPRQQSRIFNAAQGWLMAHPEHAELELGFDAILIAPRSPPRHLLAAFDASP